MITFLFFLIAMLLMATAHETGHKLAAALVRVPVPEVRIGVGPTWLHLQWMRTRFNFGVLPIGGYTRVHGLDPKDAFVPVRGDYRLLHPVQQMLVVLAGPLANVLFACVLHGVLCLVDGATWWNALACAATAPLDILHGVLALWCDAFGITIDAMDLRTNDGSLRGFVHMLATGNMLVAVLNLVPTPQTDGGKLMQLLKQR